MPPKPKYEKRDMIDAALQIARESGISAVTAREVAARLGCSTRPVFTCFSGMEELQNAVTDAAWEMFYAYLRVADDYVPAFKKRGLQMVRFAKEEPKLFRLLFMTESTQDYGDWSRSYLHGFEKDIAAIKSLYHVSKQEASLLFHQVFLCTCGVCTLQTSNVCTFSEQELVTMFGCAFGGTMTLIRSGNTDAVSAAPVHKDSPQAAVLQAEFPQANQSFTLRKH